MTSQKGVKVHIQLCMVDIYQDSHYAGSKNTGCKLFLKSRSLTPTSTLKINMSGLKKYGEKMHKEDYQKSRQIYQVILRQTLM